MSSASARATNAGAARRDASPAAAGSRSSKRPTAGGGTGAPSSSRSPSNSRTTPPSTSSATGSPSSRRQNSALWIGTFEDESWAFVDEGTVYRFPTDDNGDRSYFNIEGVAWLSPDKIAAVSDKRKKGDQPKAAKRKDQSVHIFRIPG